METPPVQPAAQGRQPPAANPAWAGMPQPDLRLPRLPWLAVRSKADLRLVVGSLVTGVCFDLAVRSGVPAIATSVAVASFSIALLLSRRLAGRTSIVLIAAAAVLGLTFTFLTSPWVTVPVMFAVIFLLLLGPSLAADGDGLPDTLSAVVSRIGVVAAHLFLAPGMFRFQGESAENALARKWGTGVLRGVAIGLPVLLVTGLLLASADPIFRSWFNGGLILQQVVLLIAGAWLMTGLARAVSTSRPLVGFARAPKLGPVEVAIVLGGLSAMYAAFVAAQFVALSGAGHRILVTQGLTYAEYARSGFFRLLACAAITLVVLLCVRGLACSDHRVIVVLSVVTAVLTLGVVVVAIRRLQLYEAAFGLTMLRLACFAVAAWIGIVFVLLSATFVPRGLPGPRFPAAFIVSGLVLIAVWASVNPAAIVAGTNLRRAELGRSLDVSQIVSLGPDAVPAVFAALPWLPHDEAAALRSAICASYVGRYAGTSFNLGRFRASGSLASCQLG